MSTAHLTVEHFICAARLLKGSDARYVDDVASRMRKCKADEGEIKNAARFVKRVERFITPKMLEAARA